MKITEIINRFRIINFEKRRHPRFPFSLPTEYSRIEIPIMHTGYTVNVSESGLLVYLPEKLTAGQKLKVKVYFNIGSNLNNVEAIAEIVWVSPLETMDKEYLCGLKFIGISPEDLNNLKRFLGNLA